MASYTDDFSTDPIGTRWAMQGATPPAETHDAGNGEWDIDVATDDPWGARYVFPLASLDHEVQVTFLQDPDGTFGPRCPSVQLRMSSTQLDGYSFNFINDVPDVISVQRTVAGTLQDVDDGINGFTNLTYTIVEGHWYTARVAAEGAAGANVALSVWVTDHGTSKPSDPGWIGVDGSPDFSFVDSDATRLDDAANLYAGLGGRSATEEYDPRYDFWKARDISERSGGGGGVVIQAIAPRWIGRR